MVLPIMVRKGTLGDAYDVAPSEPKKRGYFAKFRALRAPPLLRRKISETLIRANHGDKPAAVEWMPRV